MALQFFKFALSKCPTAFKKNWFITVVAIQIMSIDVVDSSQVGKSHWI